MRKSWQVWGSHLAVLGLFTGLTLIITYPLSLLMSRVLAGGVGVISSLIKV